MIKLTQGNILDADVEALVNTVNCVGVMGKGIALQFKQAFRDNFQAYASACKKGEVKPGRMFIFPTNKMFNPKYIINFPTKRHWKEKSKLEYIEQGLNALVTEVRRLGIKTIAIPPLGCGYGGLRWPEVRNLIETAFDQLPDIQVLLFEPGRTPEAESMPIDFPKPSLTRARALLIKLLEGDIDVPYLTEGESFRDVLLADRLRKTVKRINLGDLRDVHLGGLAGRPFVNQLLA